MEHLEEVRLGLNPDEQQMSHKLTTNVQGLHEKYRNGRLILVFTK